MPDKAVDLIDETSARLRIENKEDENILLKPPRRMTLEEALEYIESDELVEVTPKKIRLRKSMLNENDRKRMARSAALQ